MCGFVDVPYRTKIVQNVLQHLALPTLVLCILPTMEFIRIIQQRADLFYFNKNMLKRQQHVAGQNGRF